MNYGLDTYLNPKETPPDIFRAAHNNDVAELRAALAEGQLLSERSHRLVGMTPVHVAATRHSNEFLAVAIQEESFDPWIRDDNDRVAFDHAYAFNNQTGMKMLHGPMYADLQSADDSHIDYSDHAPSEFYLE